MAPPAPLLLQRKPMDLDVPDDEKAVTVRQVQKMILKVLLEEEHRYIPARAEGATTSPGEMFEILQTSLVQAL